MESKMHCKEWRSKKKKRLCSGQRHDLRTQMVTENAQCPGTRMPSISRGGRHHWLPPALSTLVRLPRDSPHSRLHPSVMNDTVAPPAGV